MFDVEGFILVGGTSSRMGQDKSRLLFAGRSGVQLIAEALAGVTDRVQLVGSRADPANFRQANVPDLLPEWGPLAGIQAALRACDSRYCFIVACDLVFVTAGLFARLWEVMKSSEPRVDAVVPLQSDDRPQPLCALYHTVSCLPAAELSIDKGEHRPKAVLDQVRTHYVPFRELRDLPGSDHFFFNLNTPADYERAKQVLELRDDCER